jgi:hypothetical protein
MGFYAFPMRWRQLTRRDGPTKRLLHSSARAFAGAARLTVSAIAVV